MSAAPGPAYADSAERQEAGRGEPVHIVTVGWDPTVSECVFGAPGAAPFRLSHVALSATQGAAIRRQRPGETVLIVRDSLGTDLPAADGALLAALEGPGLPTVHNMILGDRVVRELEYEHALAYATCLAQRFLQIFRQLSPSLVIGGFDGVHAGIGCAVARQLKIPWVALRAAALPTGFWSFCSGLTPDTELVPEQRTGSDLRPTAERILDEFRAGRLDVPAYSSANTVKLVLERMPGHAATLARALWQALTRRHDPWLEQPPAAQVRKYFRRRMNLLTLPTQWFRTEPPDGPFLFFGLHMQPESSIDVWAPFFADQFAVVAALARATPPTHRLLVKLHKSDADNYSRRTLARFRALPGVELVSPFVPSRAFLDKSSLVVTIQGTMGLEAAILGRPVLVFGESRLHELPGVTRVGALTALPAQIRALLSQRQPHREAIIDGLAAYLRAYWQTRESDWTVAATQEELDRIAACFMALARPSSSERLMQRT